jgi:hypothetical protein
MCPAAPHCLLRMLSRSWSVLDRHMSWVCILHSTKQRPALSDDVYVMSCLQPAAGVAPGC